MKQFAKLIESIDSSSSTRDKTNVILQYLNTAPVGDKLWMVAILFQRGPKRIISSARLKEWAIEASGCPLWLYEECYNVTGDLAEACAGIMPPPMGLSALTLSEWMQSVLEMAAMDSETDKEYAAQTAWQQLDAHQRFIFNKLITGGLRTGVTELTVVNAIARYSGLSHAYVQTRLSLVWNPVNITLDQLLNAGDAPDYSKPYAFGHALALNNENDLSGSISDWQIEWKWDGLRAQIVKRNQTVYIWSGDTVLITEKFPELSAMAAAWPDGTVADGEIVIIKNGLPSSLKLLHTRMARKTAGKKVQEDFPVCFIGFDLFEYNAEDIRKNTLKERRQRLEELYVNYNTPVFVLSEILYPANLEEAMQLRRSARNIRAEGLMLKHVDGKYPGENNGEGWWKWKADPHTILGVMIYAQRGNNRNAGPYTDFTIGVWQGDYLVPVARIHGGFTDEEIEAINLFIKNNAIESFGPVRSVKGELVFEISFESIDLSPRHKSGITLKSPKILHWHKDIKAADASTLDVLKTLAEQS